MDNLFPITEHESGEHLSVRNVKIDKSCEYVYSWFTANNKKPPITVPDVNDTHIPKLRNAIKGLSAGNACDVQTASAYMIYHMKRMKATLDTDWKSYGQVIASAGASINPLSLLTVEYAGDIKYSGNEGTATDADDKWLMGYTLCVYRLGRANDEKYRTALSKTMSTILMNQGSPNTLNLQTDAAKVSNWCLCPIFRKLVAAIDMFFFRFQEHDWSFLRIGTIGSRYKDCSSLLSVAHTSRLLGFEHPAELWLWVTSRTLHLEMKKMFINNDEYNNPYSYFPYQIEMGLVKKSAYSTRENPGVHAFCHLIGLYYQNARSMRALWILENDVNTILFNAHLVGYAFTRGSWANQFYVIRGHVAVNPPANQDNAQDVNMGGDGDEDDDDDDNSETQSLSIDKSAELKPPSERTPTAWVSYLDYYKWSMSPDMVRTARRVSQHIVAERERSVAKFAKSPAFYFNMEEP